MEENATKPPHANSGALTLWSSNWRAALHLPNKGKVRRDRGFQPSSDRHLAGILQILRDRHSTYSCSWRLNSSCFSFPSCVVVHKDTTDVASYAAQPSAREFISFDTPMAKVAEPKAQYMGLRATLTSSSGMYVLLQISRSGS